MLMSVVPYSPETWNSGEVPRVTAWTGGLGALPSSGGGLVRSSEITRTAPLHMVDCTKPTSPPMRSHRPFGPPGGAAGEQDHRGVVLGQGHVDVVQGCPRANRHKVGPVVLDHQARRTRLARAGALQAGTVGDHQRGLAQRSGVVHLVGGPPAVVGRHDGPDAGGGEERHHPLRAVGREDGHPVAVADSPLTQGGGGLGYSGDEVVEGEPLAFQHQELPVAEVGGISHHLPQRAHPVHEHRRRLSQDLLGGQLEHSARPGQFLDHVLANTHGPAP